MVKHFLTRRPIQHGPVGSWHWNPPPMAGYIESSAELTHAACPDGVPNTSLVPYTEPYVSP
jgi:hypothetical protein